MNTRWTLTLSVALALGSSAGAGLGPAAAQTLDFSSGFASTAGLTLNGSAMISGSALRLTDGSFGEAGSAFSSSRVNISRFTTGFTFQLLPGTDFTADGITFTVQGVDPTALGLSGGALGYANILRSVAVKFDLYDNFGEGSNSTGLYTGGVVPALPAVNLDGTGIDLHTSDVFGVTLTYDGATLTETIVDHDTQATFTTSYAVDIPAAVGGPTAFVGFTGGTGGLTAIQDIRTWTFTCTASPTISNASANPAVLRPPNKAMVPVTINYDAVSPCDTPLTCTLAVSSNEPSTGAGSGKKAPDWEVLDAHHVLLRAERAGSGNGRVYTITIACTDSHGATSRQAVTVTVPHN